MFIHTISWEGNNVDLRKINWIAVFIYLISACIMLYGIIHLIEVGHKWYWKY